MFVIFIVFYQRETEEKLNQIDNYLMITIDLIVFLPQFKIILEIILAQSCFFY